MPVIFSLNVLSIKTFDVMLAVIFPICTPNLNTLIYGNPEASNDDNIVFFKAVQRFLYKSKRFNQ